MSLLAIRDGNGKLPSFAWPGGYPIFYVTRDGLTICPKCANFPSNDPPESYGIYWEGPPMTCDDCGKDVKSAYGDPEGDKT